MNDTDESLLTLAASSVPDSLSPPAPPPSSRKSGAVGTETGSSGERAFPAWPRDAVLVAMAMAPAEKREVVYIRPPQHHDKVGHGLSERK